MVNYKNKICLNLVELPYIQIKKHKKLNKFWKNVFLTNHLAVCAKKMWKKSKKSVDLKMCKGYTSIVHSANERTLTDVS